MIPLARSGIIRRALLLLEGFVAGIRLELRHVDEVVDAAVNVRDGGLIGREAPLVVDDEFEGVLAALEVVDVGEVVPGAVHGYLPRPVVECSGDVDVPPAVLPPEDRGDDVVVGGGELGDVGLHAGVGHGGRGGAGAGAAGQLVVVGHGRIGCRVLHGGGVGALARDGAWVAVAVCLCRRGGLAVRGVARWCSWVLSLVGVDPCAGSSGWTRVGMLG